MDENEIKHLELIQDSITRMGQNSFQMKGWALAVVTALLAVFASSMSETSSGNVIYIFIGIAPTIVFWLLDSYYLQQERKFRGVYNDVAKLSAEDKRVVIRPFEMPLHKYTKGKYSFWSNVFSKTEWPLYLPTIVGLIGAGIILGC